MACTTLLQAGRSVALVVAAAEDWLITNRRDGAATAASTPGSDEEGAGEAAAEGEALMVR
jgi:hypothetical protein